ncbi:hypothetical protein [Peredibacter starrii]|uniref:Glycosyltransferase n=1 Tax=Peredibacter starrii TaxID=28202 RepID=A0AAX4HKS1_9BACT|nr:hypothetical protein [Peredibacter starrii]WPU63836.1 hypothetical protein SOO65_14165 [Peredibacter starrii]
MLGLLALGLTVVMIYTLVKNALVGTQLSADDRYAGSMELIIPITSRSEFYLEPWLKNLTDFHSLNGQLKIHILIDGHHPAVNAWQELHQKLPYVELHSFLMRPIGRESVPWMIEQIAPKIRGQVVIIGDAELVPTEHAFISLSRLVSEKQKAYFALPQTAKLSVLGEAVASVSPTLALASIFGFRKIRRNISHPLISLSQGWMGMPLSFFQEMDFSKINLPSWKEALAKKWDLENRTYILAFAERHLLRYYPEDIQVQTAQIRIYWEELWLKGDRTGLWLYLVSLFIWSFPIFCIFTHPFWSMASIVLLVLFRFFTKIVFQERWGAAMLHPVACIVWIGTFLWWGITGLKTKYGSKRPAV